MSPEARRLLLAALDAIDGRSWGPRFESVLQELAESPCTELIRLLVAAGDGDERAFWELREAAAPEHAPVLLDVVTAFAPASYGPN